MHAARRTLARGRVVAVIAVLGLLASGCAVSRVSVSSGGTEGNGPSSTALGVTDDGRYVLFASTASNLVPGDTNGWIDLFRRDEITKTTVRVDVTNAGGQLTYGAAGSGAVPVTAAMSADGRYVAFVAVEALTSGGPTSGVYVRDLTAGTTTLASVPPSGGFPDGTFDEIAMSADGRYVSFTYAPAGPPAPEGFGDSLYRSDRQAGTTVQLTDTGRTAELHASRDGLHYSLYPQCAHGCTTAPELFDADGSAAGWPALQFTLCWADDFTTFSPDGRFAGYVASGFLTTAGCLAKGNYLIDRTTGVATPFTKGNILGIAPGAASRAVRRGRGRAARRRPRTG